MISCAKKCCMLYCNNTVHKIPKEWPKHTGYTSGICILDTYRRKVLLVKTINKKWSIPKGMVEVGESFIETAIREVKEETNINCTKKQIYKNPTFSLKNKKEESLFFTMFTDSNAYTIKSPKNSPEIFGIGWINLDCIFSSDFFFQLNSPSKRILSIVYNNYKQR